MELTDLVLDSVKHDIGIHPSDTSFDNSLVGAINTSFSILYQLGFGTAEFMIVTGAETWDDVASLVPDYGTISEVRTWLSNQVRMYFDPAGMSSSMNSALKEANKELEWRINAKYDRGWQ